MIGKQQELPRFSYCGHLRVFAGVCRVFAGILQGVLVAKSVFRWLLWYLRIIALSKSI
jgi:hypothetical protein